MFNSYYIVNGEKQKNFSPNFDLFEAEILGAKFSVNKNGKFICENNAFFVENNGVVKIDKPELRKYVEAGIDPLNGNSFSNIVALEFGDKNIGFEIDLKKQKIWFFVKQNKGSKVYCVDRFIEVNSNSVKIEL